MRIDQTKFWIDNQTAVGIVSSKYPEFHEKFQELVQDLIVRNDPKDFELRKAINTYLGLQRSRLYTDMCAKYE